jgi:hypothetical protein
MDWERGDNIPVENFGGKVCAEGSKENWIYYYTALLS